MHKRILLTVFITLALAWPAATQCPPKTVVSDTLLNANGTPASGRVVIAWPTFQAGTCQVISGQVTVSVLSGSFSVELYANDAAIPEGTSYRVTYYLKSGRVTTEYWVVSSSATPVALATVRSPTVPIPNVMFSQAQVTNLIPDLGRKVELPTACPAGKFLQANGATSPPQVSCVDGSGAPLATSSQSGTVKTDVTEGDPRVYTKASADALLAEKAAAVHVHAAADLTSGTLDPSRLPTPAATTLGGVKSGACSGTDKVTGISTSGIVTCGTDQTGGGGSSSQHQVNGTNLAANDPVNFQDSATIAMANSSAGNITAAVNDGSITAAKLNAANPTAGQLSGLSDANIAAAALSPDRVAGTAVIQSRAINTTAPLAGGGALSADRTLSIQADGIGPTQVDETSNYAFSGQLVSAGALTCGAGTAGRIRVHTTALQYCDNSGTPALQYAAYGDSSGNAKELAGISANGLAVRIGSAVWTSRSIAGTGSNIVVSNGDGVNGNPTIDIGANIVTPSSTHTLTNKTYDAEASGNTLGFVSKVNFAAAGCSNATAAPAMDLPTSNAPVAACLGTTTTQGVLEFADGSTQSATVHATLPSDWTSTGGIDVRLFFTGDTSSANNIRWQVSFGCVADGEDAVAPSYNSASASNSAGPSTAGQRKSATLTGVNVSSCAAGETLYLKIERVGADAGDTYTGKGRLMEAEITLRRSL